MNKSIYPKSIILIFLHDGEQIKDWKHIFCESRTAPQHVYLPMGCMRIINHLVSRITKDIFAITMPLLPQNRASDALYAVYMQALFTYKLNKLVFACDGPIWSFPCVYAMVHMESKLRTTFIVFIPWFAKWWVIGHDSDVTDFLCVSVSHLEWHLERAFSA